MRIDRVAMAEPPEFVPVTVEVAATPRAVGVPVTTPVAASKIRPAGSAGAMLQEVMAPPETMGTMGEIAAPLVKT